MISKCLYVHLLTLPLSDPMLLMLMTSHAVIEKAVKIG